MTMRSACKSGAGTLVFWAIIWPFWPSNLFLAPKFFGGLNQNSANKISAKFSFLVILKISCKKSIFAKSRTEILAILEVFIA